MKLLLNAQVDYVEGVRGSRDEITPRQVVIDYKFGPNGEILAQPSGYYPINYLITNRLRMFVVKLLTCTSNVNR